MANFVVQIMNLCVLIHNDNVVLGAGVKGAFHWHGWANGDSFGIWDKGNVNGSTKVLKILRDM